MSLPRDVYWTIESVLTGFSRLRGCIKSDQNLLFSTKTETEDWIQGDDERPVKVKIVRVK